MYHYSLDNSLDKLFTILLCNENMPTTFIFKVGILREKNKKKQQNGMFCQWQEKLVHTSTPSDIWVTRRSVWDTAHNFSHLSTNRSIFSTIAVCIFLPIMFWIPTTSYVVYYLFNNTRKNLITYKFNTLF